MSAPAIPPVQECTAEEVAAAAAAIAALVGNGKPGAAPSSGPPADGSGPTRTLPPNSTGRVP